LPSLPFSPLLEAAALDMFGVTTISAGISRAFISAERA